METTNVLVAGPTHPPASLVASTEMGLGKRMAFGMLGMALLTFGLGRRSLAGVALALASVEPLYRGLTGRRHVLRALSPWSREQREVTVRSERIDVERSLVLGKPADELHRLFREPRTLARCMEGIAEVTPAGENLLHWKIGRGMEFDTRFVEDRPGEWLRWESLEGAEHQGSVRFRPAPGDGETVVLLRLQPLIPGNALARAVAKVMVGWVLDRALRRFERLAETSERASI